jgi:hypothetical protein
MSPERAFGIGLKIAAEIYDQIAELGGANVRQAREIVLAAAKRLGLTDADAAALIEQWPRVMARVRELQKLIVEQEGERVRHGVCNLARRARSL